MWNANGLLQRKVELSHYLHSEGIGIALISKTHLTSRLRAEIYNYKLYTCNHPSVAFHGGSSVYIRNSIVHYKEAKYKSPHIQAACDSTKLHCRTKIIIATIYSPPKHNISEAEYIDIFTYLGDKWICGGDYNFKHLLWGSRLNTAKGKTLYSVINTLCIQCFSNGTPTY